ncbi:MAG: sulfotransferase domain-containing protein [Ignavibacteriales bacterium]|nr:sulfotransferase domain-containing protein [Ignavibacteriales bacterium]
MNLEKIVLTLAAPICKQSMKKYIRPDDIFIVTYPKSGTHWLRYIFAYLINSKYHLVPQITFNNLQEIVPDINTALHRINALSRYDYITFRRVFVTHAPVYFEDIFPNIIYIVRDPRDVLVSYYFHQKRNKKKFRLTLDEFILQFDNLMPCSWIEHVNGWLGAKHKSLFKISYEDMHVKIRYIMNTINSQFSLNYSKEELEKSIINSDIKKLQTIEKQFGTPEVNGDPNIDFFRKGDIGSFKSDLKPNQINFINLKVKETISKFNLNYKI